MTKAEWVELIAKEFKVNNATAKTMLHKMIQVVEAKKDKNPGTMAAALKKAGAI